MEDYYDEDAAFKALIDGPLNGQHPAADVPCLRATFTLDVPAKLCQGGGGERKAPTFLSSFAADIAEHCKIARSVATSGAPRAALLVAARQLDRPTSAHHHPRVGSGGRHHPHEYAGRPGGRYSFLRDGTLLLRSPRRRRRPRRDGQIRLCQVRAPTPQGGRRSEVGERRHVWQCARQVRRIPDQE